jgi:hypothetical protein
MVLSAGPHHKFVMNDNTSDGATAAIPRKKNKPKDKKAKAPGSAPTAVRSGAVIKSKSDTNAPAERFTFILGPEEKALHDYLRCVFNPADYTARVPVSPGGFELYTQLWRTYESGTAIAGADGNAVIGLGCSSWVEGGNNDGVPDFWSQILGYNNSGAAIYRSNNAAAAVAAAFLPVSNAIGPNNTATDLDRPTDQALTANTRIRLVAVELAIHSVAAANTAKGEIMLCGTVNPTGGIGGGSLNGATWDQIDKTNPEVITKAVRAIPNWKSDEVFSIVAIPGEAQAFEMVLLPLNGSVWNGTMADKTVPYLHLGMLARSMTPGDQLSYKATFVWETELAKTNQAESKPMKVVPVPQNVMDVAKSAARPYAVANKVPGIHALPWVETLGQTNPAAVYGLGLHPSIPAKLKGPRPAGPLVVHRPDQPSFFSNVLSAGKNLLKGVSQSGVLSKIPYVGPLVQGVGNVLSSLFD